MRRLAFVLGAALAFGAVAAWAKGPGTDGVRAISQVRSAAGNLSAPWVLVAFAAGAQTPRIRSAAVLGLLATMTALVAFYAVTTLFMDLGGHGYGGNLRLELSANRGYLEGGLVSGLLFGALGGWWRRSRPVRASILVGVLLMAEPIVLVVLGAVHSGGALPPSAGLPAVIRIVPGWGLSAHSGAASIGVYAAEFIVGLGMVLAATVRSRRVPAA
jgi:hypothetical protein